MRESPQAADTTGSQCNHITRRPQRERPARGPAQRGSTACASRRRRPTRQDRNATTLQGGRGVSARTKIDPVGVKPALLANAVRMLAADAVERAKSGHPGAPLGMAEIAEALWRRHLKHNPANPAWPDRDRFVLSNGHGSMLLYALLHLTGYDLPLDELKRFRQLHSRTPGHPECGVTPGVETTTGPLGQGLANAVGMALAEKLLAAHFNRPGLTIVDHRTYAFVGDGCLMEGVSHEACSLAGALALAKLVMLYDDNGISIDGDVSGWFRDDTPKRFEAYGWNVIRDVDGHDAEAVDAALHAARARADRPTLVCCKTQIGRGAPTKAGSHDVHGAPLGASEIAAMRAALGWPHGPFEIPAEIAAAWDARPRGALQEQRWREMFDRYARAHPALAAEFERRVQGMLPDGWDALAASLFSKACAVTAAKATRKLSQEMLDELVAQLPELLGGSADLTGSNLTAVAASRAINGNDGDGNYLHYGGRDERRRAARRLHSVRRHVSRVLRLRAQCDPDERAHAPARRLRAHTRLDRPRRGRTDAPAGRARGEPAADPQRRRLAAVRCAGDGRRVGRGARARQRSQLSAAVATERARARAHAQRCRGDPQRRLRAAGCRVGAGARRRYRDRHRGRDRARRATDTGRRRNRRARRVDAVHERVRPNGARLPRRRAAAVAALRVDRSGCHVVLARVHRARRPRARHRSLRRIGAGERAVRTFRSDSDRRRRGGPRLDRNTGNSRRAIAFAGSHIRLNRFRIGIAMALISLRQLLDDAAEHGYAVPAFNVNNMEQIHAIMRAAVASDSPVILQASAGARKYAGEPFLRKLVEAAVEANPQIPICLHQDHGATPAVCQQAIRSGFTSVMMDGSLQDDQKTDRKSTRLNSSHITI